MKQKNITILLVLAYILFATTVAKAFSDNLLDYYLKKETIAPLDHKYHYGYKKGIKVTVTPEKSEFVTGSIATFTITVTNISKYAINLDYPTGQHWDLIIYKGKTPIFRWSKPYEWKKSPHSIALKPGESKSEQLCWETLNIYGNPLDQGVYNCAGIVTTSPKAIVSSNVSFRLGPPSVLPKEIINTKLNQCFDIELPRFANGEELKWELRYVYNDNRIDATIRKKEPEIIKITFMPKRLGHVEFFLYAYTKNLKKALERRYYRIEVE